jgi:arginyl-tRNA synthetase
MKKALFTLLIGLVTWGCAWAGKPTNVESLVRQYENNEGFEVISMGELGMSLIKMVAVLGGDLDEEDRAVLNSFNGLKKVMIVDFDNAEETVKEQFTSQLHTILDKMELILEAKDGGSVMRIYGVDEGDRIRDCVLYSGDGALIYTRGSIATDKLGDLMEMAQ